MDIVSAIDEKRLGSLDALLPITCFTGRLARFLNAVRTDTKSKKLGQKLLERFAARSGINVAGFDDIRLYLSKLGVGKIDDEGKLEVTIDSVDDIYKICGNQWVSKLTGSEDTEDWLIVNLMEFLRLPCNPDSILSAFGNRDQTTSLLQVLYEAGIVLFHKKLNVYFSPKYFGRDQERVSTFVDRTNGGTREFINLLEAIQECQGFPYDEVAPKLRREVDVALYSGILEPVQVIVSSHPATFLFTPEPTEDKIYLSKETTAHFRYNERYADPTKGRLRDTSRFLNVLIEKGSAGAADNIATNYLALEEKGVVVSRIGGVTGLPRMVARKIDVLKDTLALVQERQPIKSIPKSWSIAEWVKNPVESRVGRPAPRIVDENLRLDLVRMLRDEIR